jgi:2-haloacid dehalogenase
MGKIRLISFDCYGTLIDWKKGVLDAIHPLLEDYFIEMDNDQIFSLFAEYDAELVTGEFMTYRLVLREIMERFTRKLNLNIHQVNSDLLTESMSGWQPFTDTVPALKELKARGYQLAVLSNVDRDLLEKTLSLLDTAFDIVITSEELGSYKPSPDNFMEALRRFRFPADEVIHAAQSRFHDIIPARDLGITAAWINRYNDPVPPIDEEFSGMRFPDLSSFVAGLTNLDGC